MFLLPFHVVGLSRETIDADCIGQLSASAVALDAMRDAVAAMHVPFVLLTTCHRVELYWWGDAELAELFATCASAHGALAPGVLPERRDADLAVRHLFGVASGLRSQRVGEPEILGQLRRAWLESRGAGRSTPDLDAMMERAILAARRIRQSAGIEDRGASLGEAATERLTGALGDVPAWATRRALVVGSGAVAESAVHALRAVSPASITLMSRTDSRAIAVAASLQIASAPWSGKRSVLAQSDIVIFATRGTEPVVDATDVEIAMRARVDDARWLDLGVPPNVAKDVAHSRLHLLRLTDLRGNDSAEVVTRAQRALQHEMARFAAELQRRSFANHLAVIERETSAVTRDTVHRLHARHAPTSDAVGMANELDAAAVAVARRVTWLLMRELTHGGRRETNRCDHSMKRIA